MVSYTNNYSQVNNMAYDVESAGREFHDELPVARDSDSDSDTCESKSASSLQKFLYGGLAVGAVVLGGAGCYGAYQYLNAEEVQEKPTPTPSTPVVSTPTPTSTTPSGAQPPAAAQPPAPTHTDEERPAGTAPVTPAGPAPVTPAVTVPATTLTHPVHTPVEADFVENALREDTDSDCLDVRCLDGCDEVTFDEKEIPELMKTIGCAMPDEFWSRIMLPRESQSDSDSKKPIYFQYIDMNNVKRYFQDDLDLQEKICKAFARVDVDKRGQTTCWQLDETNTGREVFLCESKDRRYRLAVVQDTLTDRRLFRKEDIETIVSFGSAYPNKEWNLVDTNLTLDTATSGPDSRPIYFQYFDKKGRHYCKPKNRDADLHHKLCLAFADVDLSLEDMWTCDFTLHVNGKNLTVFPWTSEDLQFRMAVVKEVE